MRELAEAAACEVVKHTGLPMDFIWQVSASKNNKPAPNKYIGRLWTSPEDLHPIKPFYEIDIWDGVLTVRSGFAYRFPGQKEEVNVVFRFVLPRQESISGKGYYSIASTDGLFQVGNLNARHSLHEDDGVTFDEAMDEWCYSADFWKHDREIAGWSSATDEDCNDEFGREHVDDDDDDDDEGIDGVHDVHGVTNRITTSTSAITSMTALFSETMPA
jgi:hypothetical protein